MASLPALPVQDRIGGARFRLMRPNRLQAVWPGAGVGGRTRTYGLLLVTEVILPLIYTHRMNLDNGSRRPRVMSRTEALRALDPQIQNI
jgi:hypothetical protein